MPDNSTQPFAFAGFAKPNYTQVPDELFDLLMPRLSECELRVLLYIIRRTFGFKRDADFISLSQLVDGIITREGERLDYGAGVARSSAVRALKGLVAKGVITATKRSSLQRGNETTSYGLRFKTASAPEKPTLVVAQFHGETRGASSMVKPALVSSRNPQETVEQETAFESSKGEDFGDRTEVGEGTHPALPASKANQTTSAAEEGTLGEILRHRIRRDVGREDRSAISVAMERFAEELGDQADIKVSISRALNLFQTTGASRDVFVDCLYQARGEVLDRRAYPGKAPIPRKLMAYFFAVVEDRLGLKQPTR